MASIEKASGVLAAARPSSSRWSGTQVLREDVGFDVFLDESEDAIVRRWTHSAPQAATVFQSRDWLGAWYATIGRAYGRPLLLTAVDRETGGLAAMLPLVRRKAGRLRVIEFADLGVSDSNGPALGPYSPSTALQSRAMWRALRRHLSGADLIRFTKMPREIEGRVNPLVLLPSVRTSQSSCYVLSVNEGWDAYHASLKGMLRKQLRKNWRTFSAHEGAAFRRITDPEEALRVLDVLEAQQGARLRAQGEPYRLDEPAFSAFYRRITSPGVVDGSVIVTALMCHDEVVAALLGLARGGRYVMVRTSIGAERWANCSPGRLLILRTMQMLEKEGFRLFDFSVGDYPYKRRLGAQNVPLFDLTMALTPIGLPALAADQAKTFLRQHPRLFEVARRMVKGSAARDAAGMDGESG